MTVVREHKTGDYHEADETQSGWLTACSRTLAVGEALEAPDGFTTTCKACAEPVAQVLTGPPERRTGKSNRPRWRTSHNVITETIENTKFAHKEVVAALEWFDRGGETQFMQTGLGRVHLAYRFLQEILIAHGLVERPRVDEDDE